MAGKRFGKKAEPARTPILSPSPPPLVAGDRVGNFTIVEKLGEGGMGVVYKAKRTHTDEPAVIKVLHPWLSQNPTATQRFLAEARAAGTIRHRNKPIKHRNIVTVYDVGQRDDGQWYIAMEFLEGSSLAFKLHSLGGPLGPADIIELLAQVANALHDAHEHGIIHRDIKPENIFVTDNHVTLLDFGIAKLDAKLGGGGTSAGTVLGTPLYMAPEQLRGEEVDRRADVYAAAAVAWEMAVGEPLWGGAGDAPAAIMERQATNARPLNPCMLAKHLPPRFGEVIAWGLAFDREQRAPTMQEWLLALAHTVTTDFGESGMAIVRRVADELPIVDADNETAGREHVPPHVAAPTLRAFPVVPMHGIPTTPLTPAPPPLGRADAPTVASRPLRAASAPPPKLSTFSEASGVSEPIVIAAASPGPETSPRTARIRGVWIAGVGAVLAIGVVSTIIVASRGGGERAASGEPLPAPQTATSALAIVTEPEAASIHVDGVAQGLAPLNVVASVGAEVDVRAELPGHIVASQRVRIGAEPATVRLRLVPLIDAGAAPEFEAPDAATPIDAGTRPRTRPRPPRTDQHGTFDPDGVIGP